MITLAFWGALLLAIWRFTHRRPLRNRMVRPPRRPPIDPFLRRRVMTAQHHMRGFECFYCHRHSRNYYLGPDGKPWCMDHVLPYSLGGPTTFENLVLACWTCNSVKGAHVLIRHPVKRR